MFIEAKQDRASRIEKPQPRDRDYYYYSITHAMNKLSSGAKLTVVARGKDPSLKQYSHEQGYLAQPVRRFACRTDCG